MFGKLPFYWKYALKASGEFVYIITFSLMPVWLGAIIQPLTNSSVLQYLDGYFTNGEALLLSTATVGPLIYTILKDDEEPSSNNRKFPGKQAYILIISIICVLSAAVFSLKSATKFPLDFVFNSNYVWHLSLYATIFSILIWFLVSGTQRARSGGAPAIMHQDTEDFTNRFREG